VQYFPSADYLVTVLEGAVRAVRPGGTIYVGDVRNLNLLEAFHTAIQVYKAPDDLLLSQLQTHIQQQLQDEAELLIDPQFFYNLNQVLPKIAQVEVQLKRGRFYNELTQFRYQVVLHIAVEHHVQPVAAPHAWCKVDWLQDELTESTLTNRLNQECKCEFPSSLFIHDIPNARLQDAIQNLSLLAQANAEQEQEETLADLRSHLKVRTEGVDPESLWSLAETLPYNVHVTWSQNLGMIDAYLFPRTSGEAKVPVNPTLQSLTRPAIDSRSLRHFTNNPLQGNINRNLVTKLRSWLEDKLPKFMIPSDFMLLHNLPINHNGKVDRKALPALIRLRRVNIADTPFVLPRTPVEEILAAIWSEFLGLERVCVYDNFFELGGHSLLAMQVISRVRDAFQVELPLRVFFENSTIASLASSFKTTTNNRTSLIKTRIARINHIDRGQALANIDNLSDEDVDLYLKEIFDSTT
jgi:acyl carrier protein